MSDFLFALAARSLGAAPSLAPRPASRFEAPAPLAEPGFVEASFESSPAAGEGRREMASETHPALVPPPPAPRIAPEPRSARSDDFGPTTSPRRSSEEGERAAPPSIEPSAGPPVRPSIEPIGEPRIDPVPRDPDRPNRAESPILPVSPAPVRPRDQAPRPVASAEPERIAPARPGGEDAAAPIHPMTVPAAPRKGTEGGDAPLPVIVPRAEPLPPMPTPRLAAAPASAHPAESAEPAAPVIRVSIGRIEVRAAQPAPAPPPQPRPGGAPRLSLDDYLRSGARRRP
jgi:hypothetical protein